MSLSASDFSAFYSEVHNEQPFAWQRDLVDQVLAHGAWPSLVDVPTGLGKTALLDIAVFVTALTAGQPGAARLGRRRVFFVVDRRIIVDQAHERAEKIAAAVGTAPVGSATEAVARRLAALASEPQDPGPDRTKNGRKRLHVVKMRGGITWDAAWLTQPDHLGIVTGTVDQVGSRLLFRGYGVSPRRWPIDAALVGTDSLILLDEAHLSTPLIAALDTARVYDRPLEPMNVPAPSIVQLTATSRAGSATGWTHEFDDEAHLTHGEPVARRRLLASKRLEVRDSAKASIVRDLAGEAARRAECDGARVLVVCNTVDRARTVHAHLAKILPESCALDLLIGRSREPDRARVTKRVMERFGAGVAANPGAAVLVATQTVEVGVDLDATALVTECASWDALAQRIGRVNRRGEQAEPAPIVVLDAGPQGYPVYREAKVATWSFLRSQTASSGWMDVSPKALRELHDVPGDCYVTSRPAPLLLPAHLDAWTRTAPPPSNDAPLESYLHGLDAGPAGVTLVWRDGFLDAGEQARPLLEALPPRSAESVEVPLSAVRRWLAGAKPEPVSDWDEGDDWDDIAFDDRGLPHAFAQRTDAEGQSRWMPVFASQVRPGDLLVVPTELGGLDEYGWAPESTVHVRDIAELAAFRAGRFVLRLDGRLPDRLGLPALPEDVSLSIRALRSGDDPDGFDSAIEEVVSTVITWLRSAPPSEPSCWSSADLAKLAAGLKDGKLNVDSDPATLTARTTRATRLASLADGLDDGTVNCERRVTLAEHHRRVGTRAAEIAAALGLDPALAGVVVDAARWHDLGKVDPRFQAMLFGGDPLQAVLAREPLAKSGMAPGAWAQRRQAKRRSGLPTGARHEAWSAALLASYAEVNSTEHGDLLIHLVASHHGHGRPLLPPVEDDATHDLEGTIDGQRVAAKLPHAVDVDAAARFQLLNERHGRWGLALLEAIVRCADMTISAEGS